MTEYLVTPELVSLAKVLEKDLEDIGVNLQKIVDWSTEYTYQCYKRSRIASPLIPPGFYESFYKREDIEIMEERFLREQNELKG